MTTVGDISRRIESRRKRHVYIRDGGGEGGRDSATARRGETASFRVLLPVSERPRKKGTSEERRLARRGKAGRTRDERDARDHSPVNCLPSCRVPSSVMLLLLLLRALFRCCCCALLALLLFPPSPPPPPPLSSFTVAHRQCHRLAHVVPTKTSSTILHLTRHSAPVKQLNIILFKKMAIVAGLGEIDGT